LTGQDDNAAALAAAIQGGFDRYRHQFIELTRGAKKRFESCAWHAVQDASTARLDLYKIHTAEVVAAVEHVLGGAEFTSALWRATKAQYITLITPRFDRELAETFFNSIKRDITHSEVIDDTQMFVWSAFVDPPPGPEAPLCNSYLLSNDVVANVKQMLKDVDIDLPWQNQDRDVRNILRSLAEERPEITSTDGLEVQIISAPFYRNKGAYLVGKILYDARSWPVVLPILIDPDGMLYVDTLICDEDEFSVVFSFTRSYFMVDAPHPYLHQLLPGKKRSELYAAVGLQKHGKTEFYRGFLTHLAQSDDRFVIAPGIKGMVMSVFVLPSYQTAFKVIKDKFAAPKQITRYAVKEKYSVVKKHDRVGRMADTQEFEHFVFPRSRFSDELINELLAVAASTVRVTDDLVIIDHLYTERLMTPLNLYIENADEEELRDALEEYGNAIRQLAAANIFPGDMLLKNFGVTRHGRVVFYDYDEICYLTEVNFRAIPEPKTPEQEMAAEPWYSVGPNDVFPEEFRRFLFGRPSIKQLFSAIHGELFDPAYWNSLKTAIEDGLVMDVFPYRRKKRFVRQQKAPARAQRAAGGTP
jgi:isocitrate dehydrogenase kinase/phosphatase